MTLQKIQTLVLSGGGAKGVSYCGIFRYLEELADGRHEGLDVEVDIKEIVGVSVGSFFGLIYLLGFKYIELRNEILKKKFRELQDTKVSNFLKEYGIETGANLIGWAKYFLQKRGHVGDITFSELYLHYPVHYKVITTNLSTFRSHVFDYINTPDVSVLEAIRMSISIPFVFTMKKFRGDVHVDGALTVNYPIDFATNPETALGFYFDTKRMMCDGDARGPGVGGDAQDVSLNTYIESVFKCVILSIDRHRVETCRDHTVFVTFEGMGDDNVNLLVNFNLTKKQKMDIMNCGYASTARFFSSIKKKKNVDLD
jgi:predicted acylesterase/phospholipase RssA